MGCQKDFKGGFEGDSVALIAQGRPTLKNIVGGDADEGEAIKEFRQRCWIVINAANEGRLIDDDGARIAQLRQSCNRHWRQLAGMVEVRHDIDLLGRGAIAGEHGAQCWIVQAAIGIEDRDLGADPNDLHMLDRP